MRKAFMHTPNRNEHDLYETHGGLTRLLLKGNFFQKGSTIYEPCHGKNMGITRELQEYNVISNDLYYGKDRKDFLGRTDKMRNIITNPPYNMADQFVLKGKELYQEKMAMLLRTNYLSGQKRLSLDVYKELEYIMIFNRMPDLKAPIRYDGCFPTTGIVYAWFIFTKGYVKEPKVKFLDCSQYVLTNEERMNLDMYIDKEAGKLYIDKILEEKRRRDENKR